MKALYSLSSKIASFDFFSWLVMVKQFGYTEVVFNPSFPKTDKWKEPQIRERFQSILQPGPALAGMKSSIGSEGYDPVHTDARYLIAWAKAGGHVPRLKSVHAPGDVRYTVTLRQEPRIPERNSNVEAWRAFAAEIGALVIEDWHVNPIDLHTRVALYAGAEMNFFVVNGPMHVCSLMDAPLMCFAANKCEGGLARTGIAFGEQYPWLRPGQRLIWEDDSLENLRRHFAAWRAAEDRKAVELGRRLQGASAA